MSTKSRSKFLAGERHSKYPQASATLLYSIPKGYRASMAPLASSDSEWDPASTGVSGYDLCSFFQLSGAVLKSQRQCLKSFPEARTHPHANRQHLSFHLYQSLMMCFPLATKSASPEGRGTRISSSERGLASYCPSFPFITEAHSLHVVGKTLCLVL